MMAESTHLSDALPRYPVKELPTTFKNDWTWASLRTGAEDMQPFEYFKFRYYEKWLGGISQFFIDQGLYQRRRTGGEDRATTVRIRRPRCRTSRIEAIGSRSTRYLEKGDSGSHTLRRRRRASRRATTVRIADPEAVDHTRLPGYLRNKTGVIDLVYPGTFSYFVSTGPDGIGEPMPVYRVAFDAADIWGPGKSEPNTTIYADLYEAYLHPADSEHALEQRQHDQSVPISTTTAKHRAPPRYARSKPC